MIKQLPKNQKYPTNHGYDLRNPAPTEYTIIIHTTNGRIGSTFTGEENYLYQSPLVSAHYLVGKRGQITQFLDVTRYRAWHAGNVLLPIYNNNNSIGIECHYTPGESTDLPELYDALTNLVRLLMSHYRIKDIAMHRTIAIPAGRKIDPSFWNDAEFIAWKQSLSDVQVKPVEIPIVGNKNVDSSGLLKLLQAKSIPNAHSIISAYDTFGELTGIGNLYPLAQAIHETGWFTSERWVKSLNPAGLGATNDGAWGSNFQTPSAGILAQYAHLLCYATMPEENTFLLERIAQLSPRIDAMTVAFGRGCARTWVALNGKWAFPGPTYGNKIIEIANNIQSW